MTKTFRNALIRSQEFERKKLGTHVVNPAIGCFNRCVYCYVHEGSNYSRFNQYVRKGGVIVHDSGKWLDRLRKQAVSIREKGTAILSTATEPFSKTLSTTSFIAVKILSDAGWDIRIITKRGEALLDHDLIPENSLINISLGGFNERWGMIIEQKAVHKRLYGINSLIDSGKYRVCVMACPIPPGEYDRTFKIYDDYKILDKSHEVFCEIINPRGTVYDKVGRWFPEVLKMKNKQYRSNECRDLIKIAHEYVDPSKLRVMTYRNNMTDEDFEAVKTYEGVIWL